jgi:hypothetical protein
MACGMFAVHVSNPVKPVHALSTSSSSHLRPDVPMESAHMSSFSPQNFDVLTISDEDSMDQIERHYFMSYVRRMFLQQVSTHPSRGAQGKAQPHITYRLLHEDGNDPKYIPLISK